MFRFRDASFAGSGMGTGRSTWLTWIITMDVHWTRLAGERSQRTFSFSTQLCARSIAFAQTAENREQPHLIGIIRWYRYLHSLGDSVSRDSGGAHVTHVWSRPVFRTPRRRRMVSLKLGAAHSAAVWLLFALAFFCAVVDQREFSSSVNPEHRRWLSWGIVYFFFRW